MQYDAHKNLLQLSRPGKLYKKQTKMEGSSILHAFNNIYFAIFALFCFKLLIKISLALLTHFYIVKGNRKEAARIAEEIYGIVPGKMNFRHSNFKYMFSKYGGLEELNFNHCAARS